MIGIFLKRAFGALTLFIGLVIAGWFIYNQFWPTEAYKTGFRSVFLLLLPLVFMLFGWRWMRYEGRGIEEVTPPDLKCSELDASRQEAQATLPEFIGEVDKGIDGAFVKFPLHTPQGLTEFIWGYVHFYRDGRFNVSLANDPVDRQQESDGRRDVAAEEVMDWQIMARDGSVRGAYSVIALFKYRERQGKALSPRMKKQRALLLSNR